MRIIIFVFLCLYSTSYLSASELKGTITTTNNHIISANDQEQNNLDTSGPTNSRPLYLPETRDEKTSDESEPVLVLGFSAYPSGTLLRSRDQKIYILEGEYRRHIRSLKELQQYSGQVIESISELEMAKYKIRNYKEADLLRAIDDDKIFVIYNGELKHILNLEELAKDFFGKVIYNIPSSELADYKFKKTLI